MKPWLGLNWQKFSTLIASPDTREDLPSGYVTDDKEASLCKADGSIVFVMENLVDVVL